MQVMNGIGLHRFERQKQRAELVSHLPGGDHWQKAICDLSVVVQMDI